jgi:hypothetical protein
MTYSIRLVLQYLSVLLVVDDFLLEATYATGEWYF